MFVKKRKLDLVTGNETKYSHFFGSVIKKSTFDLKKKSFKKGFSQYYLGHLLNHCSMRSKSMQICLNLYIYLLAD